MPSDKASKNLDLTDTVGEPKQTKMAAKNMTTHGLAEGNLQCVWKLSIHDLFLADNLEDLGISR